MAITLFKKGLKGNSGSMYMLGLCFRNGYGIAQNMDSARYWLDRAASNGYRYAKEELQITEPENISDKLEENSGQSNNNQNKAATANGRKTLTYSTFQRITHNAKPTEITGEYTGVVIRYDFSGQHVIGKSTLKLKLESGDHNITGTWSEAGNPVVNLQAEITDSGLVFNNSAYIGTDHYSAGKSENYLFKNAKLLVVKQKDTVFLAGNLQLWSVMRNEPEKPVYISLVKNIPTVKPVYSPPMTLKAKTAPLRELTVYPNPFKNSTQVSFNVNQQSRVEIFISDMTGRIVYKENPKSLTTGKYNFSIQPNLQLGAYLLTVNCNGQVKSTVLIKQ